MRECGLVTVLTTILVGLVAEAYAESCADPTIRPGDAICRRPSLPPAVLARSADHIATLTSRSYQRAHYSVAPDHSYEHRETDCEGRLLGHRLLLFYAPFESPESGAAEVRLFVPADPSCSPSGAIVRLDSQGDIVAPSITRDEALAIAYRHPAKPAADWSADATLQFLEVDSQWEWRWLVSAHGENRGSCWDTKGFAINARTGEVLRNFEGTACE